MRKTGWDQDLPAGRSSLSQVKDDDDLVQESHREPLDCLQENPLPEVQAPQEPGPAGVQHEEGLETSRQGQGAAVQSL